MSTPFAVGQKLTAAALDSAVMSSAKHQKAVSSTSVTTTSTTYTTTVSGGSNLSVVVTTGSEGLLRVGNFGQIGNSTAGQYAFQGFEIRTGATVGSGTIIGATMAGGVVDTQSVGVRAYATASDFVQAGFVFQFDASDGVAPNTTYNIQTFYRVQANTGTFQYRILWAEGA